MPHDAAPWAPDPHTQMLIDRAHKRKREWQDEHYEEIREAGTCLWRVHCGGAVYVATGYDQRDAVMRLAHLGAIESVEPLCTDDWNWWSDSALVVRLDRSNGVFVGASESLDDGDERAVLERLPTDHGLDDLICVPGPGGMQSALSRDDDDAYEMFDWCATTKWIVDGNYGVYLMLCNWYEDIGRRLDPWDECVGAYPYDGELTARFALEPCCEDDDPKCDVDGCDHMALVGTLLPNHAEIAEAVAKYRLSFTADEYKCRGPSRMPRKRENVPSGEGRIRWTLDNEWQFVGMCANGYTIAEIAKFFGVTTQTIKNRRHQWFAAHAKRFKTDEFERDVRARWVGDGDASKRLRDYLDGLPR